MENNNKTSEKKPPTSFLTYEVILTYLSPTLVGKLGILYFGSMYSAYPGQGYGQGLVVCIAFTLIMMGRFLWKYRNYKD